MNAASPRRTPGRRLVHGLGSQGLASISNFALVVAVARSTTSREFGAFAIVYSMVVLALLAMRGAVGETLSVTTRSEQQPQAAMGASLALGLAFGAIFAIIAVALPTGPLRPWLLLFAAGIPVLALQDAGRYVGFATHSPGIATVSDGAWLITQLIAWVAIAGAGRSTGAAFLTAWWVAAGVAALLVSLRTGLPQLRVGPSWLIRNARLARSFAGEAILASGASQSAVYAVGVVSGLPAAGGLRAAQTLYAPIRALASGIESVALPEASTTLQTLGTASLLRYQFRVAGGLAILGLLGAALFISLPEAVGQQILDETWHTASTVLLPVGLGLTAGLLLTGARLGLRAMHETDVLVRLYVLGAALVVSMGVAGALIGGLTGAAWGLTLSQFMLSGSAWWLVLRLHRRDSM